MRLSKYGFYAMIVYIMLSIVCLFIPYEMNRTNTVAHEAEKSTITYKYYKSYTFDELYIVGKAIVHLTQHPDHPYSAFTLGGTKRQLSQVSIRTAGKKLEINTNYYQNKFKDHHVLNIYIDVAALRLLEVNGIGRLIIHAMKQDYFDLKIKGAYASYAEGEVNELHLTIEHASVLEARRFLTKKLVLHHYGAASCRLFVSDFLRIKSGGLGPIRYYGDTKKVLNKVFTMNSILPKDG